MPYRIQKLCNGDDKKCVEVCPVDCIYVDKDRSSAKPLLYIDPEECTNCGACALACPEFAIVPVVAYGRYANVDRKATTNLYKSHLCVLDSEPEAEHAFRADAQIKPFEVVAETLTTAFAVLPA